MLINNDKFHMNEGNEEINWLNGYLNREKLRLLNFCLWVKDT